MPGLVRAKILETNSSNKFLAQSLELVRRVINESNVTIRTARCPGPLLWPRVSILSRLKFTQPQTWQWQLRMEAALVSTPTPGRRIP